MIREFHQTSLRGRNSFGVEQHAARLAEFETEEDLHAIFGGGIPGRWSVLSGGNNILFTQDYDGLLLTPVSQRIALLGVFVRKRQADLAEPKVNDAGLFDAVERRAGEAVRRAHEQEPKHQDRARKRT